MKRKGLLFWLSVFLMLSMIFSLGKYEIQASEGNPVAPVNIDMSIDNLFVGVGSKGFHPSSGNHLAIRTSVSCNTKQYFDGEIQLRLRILNKSGDYVYQKVYSNIGGKNIWGDSITSWENKTIYLNWNGKASKANTAGVKYGSFVPDGTYRVEVFYYAKDNSNKEYVKTITKKKSFKVSSKAPSGKDGVAAAATIPEYTGVDEIDYMAEKMITSAGIKTTMGQDEKVRRIYHWMTVNFKHTARIIDNADGSTNQMQLQSVLMEYANAGWKLHSVITNEIGKNVSSVSIGGFTGGTNATMDEVILIFERMISRGNL